MVTCNRHLSWLVALSIGCGNVEQARDVGQSSGGESALEPKEGEPPSPSNCDDYCDSVMSACQQQHTVYGSLTMCLAMCALFEPGTAVDPTGNTFACRARHARLAQAEPEQECSAAGPGGGEGCGNDCDAYCSLYPKVCPDEAGEQASDEADCRASCAALVDQPNLDVQRDHGGDTIECRLVHLSSATIMPSIHCAHARLEPSVPWCIDQQ